MTFSTIPETALAGRTCHLWLHVAYDVTPKKDLTYVLKSDSVGYGLRVTQLMLESRFKRHYTKVKISFAADRIGFETELLAMLCDGLTEMKECTIQLFNPNDPPNQRLDMAFRPLLKHQSTLTSLGVKGIQLTRHQWKIVKELRQLKTLEYSRLRANQPHPWRFDELHAFCLPQNRLARLQSLRVDLNDDFAIEHLECLKNLSSDIRLFLSFWCGVDADAIPGLSFLNVRGLTIGCRFISGSDTQKCALIAQVLLHTRQLDTFTLQGSLYLQPGQLSDLLQCQSKLTSLTFRYVFFTTPECMDELANCGQLIELHFDACDPLHLDHFKRLKSIHSLERLKYTYHDFAPPLTRDEMTLLHAAPNSPIIPSLKQFTAVSFLQTVEVEP